MLCCLLGCLGPYYLASCFLKAFTSCSPPSLPELSPTDLISKYDGVSSFQSGFLGPGVLVWNLILSLFCGCDIPPMCDWSCQGSGSPPYLHLFLLWPSLYNQLWEISASLWVVSRVSCNPCRSCFSVSMEWDELGIFLLRLLPTP